MSENMRSLGGALLLAVAGAFSLGLVTGPHGFVTSWDTACYFQAARSFAIGEGFLNFSKQGIAEPMTQYPPLYAAALSLGPFFGMDIPSWARVLGVFLFGFNVFLLSRFTFYVTASVRAAFVAGGSILFFVQCFQAHASALSEGLFFTFMVLALAELVRFLEKPSDKRLITAALLASLATLTRYAGFAVIFSGVISIFMFAKAGRGDRVQRSLSYLVMALAAPVLWLAHNAVATGHPVGFDPGVFMSSLKGLVWSVNTFYLYLFPFDIPSTLRGVIMVAAAALAVFYLRRRGAFALRPQQPARQALALRVIAVFVVIYFLTVAAAMFMSNGAIPLDQRLLLPIPLMLVVVFSPLIAEALSSREKMAHRAVLVVFMAMMIWRTAVLAHGLYTDGSGAFARARTASAVVDALKMLPEDVRVYTDNTQMFYLYTGRPSVEIPVPGRDASGLLPIPELTAAFAQKKAVAVIFMPDPFRPHPLWSSLDLAVAMKDAGGVIYVGRSLEKP